MPFVAPIYSENCRDLYDVECIKELAGDFSRRWNDAKQPTQQIPTPVSSSSSFTSSQHTTAQPAALQNQAAAAASSGSSKDVFAIGDLHSNAIRLLAFLFIIGIIEPTAANFDKYKALSELYCRAFLSGIQPSEDQAFWNTHENFYDINQVSPDRFREILGALTYSQERIQVLFIILIGDTLCDRGVSDEYMLLLFQSMADNGVDFKIIFSNHDYGFYQLFHRREQLDNVGSAEYVDYTGVIPGVSAYPLFSFGLHESYKGIIETTYFPRLTSHISMGNYLFTHAPYPYIPILRAAAQQENLTDEEVAERAIASWSGASVRPSSTSAGVLPLEQLESRFQNLLRSPSLGNLIDNNLYDFVWNRDILRRHDARVNVVGHIGPCLTGPGYINLDNSDLGKLTTKNGFFIFFACPSELLFQISQFRPQAQFSNATAAMASSGRALVGGLGVQHAPQRILPALVQLTGNNDTHFQEPCPDLYDASQILLLSSKSNLQYDAGTLFGNPVYATMLDAAQHDDLDDLKDFDISIPLPEPSQQQQQQNQFLYAIGNLSGNPILLLAFLFVIGIIEPSSENLTIYAGLANLYKSAFPLPGTMNAVSYPYNERNIKPEEFKSGLIRLKYVRREIATSRLILFGGTVCTCGVSDEYMLLLLENLARNGVFFHMIFSQNDYGFLKLYSNRRQPDSPLSTAAGYYTQNVLSVSGIGSSFSSTTLFRNQLHGDYERIIEKIYFPRLVMGVEVNGKVLSYRLSQNDITSLAGSSDILPFLIDKAQSLSLTGRFADSNSFFNSSSNAQSAQRGSVDLNSSTLGKLSISQGNLIFYSTSIGHSTQQVGYSSSSAAVQSQTPISPIAFSTNSPGILPKGQWTPDYLANKCSYPQCSKEFGFFTRKHHCRKCGGVFCDDHTKRVDLATGGASLLGERVCWICWSSLYK